MRFDYHYSYYAYDHGGERRLKLTGTNSVLDVNADYMSTYSMLDKPTLYPSAYMVLSNSGYTKHYYAGAERVCARQGNGGLDRLSDFIVSNTVLQEKSESLLMSCNNAMNGRFVQENNPSEIAAVCGGTPVELVAVVESAPVNVDVQMQVDCSSFTLAMSQFAGLTQQQEDAYFYHSDHLGSASWITDGDGKPIQHLQYLPFGEPYVDQRTSGYNERFTFTGKERDEETGYGYFGARYMNHELMTMWLSVDPMADKYPSISPYAYCAWNPVKYIDPDGDSVAVLLARDRVAKMGHMALLIQNSDNQWELWSENGGDMPVLGKILGTPNDMPARNPDGTVQTFSSIQDFLNNQTANTCEHDGDNYPYYTDALMIPTNSEQDNIIRSGMKEEMKKYNLFTSNCAQAVVKALAKAGVKTSPPMGNSGNTLFGDCVIGANCSFQIGTAIADSMIPVVIFHNIRNAHKKDGVLYAPQW